MDQQVRADEYVSHVVCLDPASRKTLKRIGDGDLGEFALVTAGISFLLWKYFRNPQVVFRTPPLAEERDSVITDIPLVVDVRREELVEDYLARVAGIVETSYTEPGFGDGQQATVSLFDERIHDDPSEDHDDDLQFRLSLDDGEIEIRRGVALESFVIESFASSLATLLPELERFGRRVDEIESLPPEERKLLPTFNDTAARLCDFPTVVAMFEAQALRTPSAAALVTDSSLMTYASLNTKANRLAHHLRDAHKVGPESMVGVMLDRSELMIVAILGVLKAGAAFVPIDTTYPRERVDYILSDTGLKLLITQSDVLNRGLKLSGHVLPLDLELPRLESSSANLPLAAAPENLAYVLYTSGSTGRPKGCLLEHRNLLNYIGWATSYYFSDSAGVPDNTTGHFGLYSSLCFDFTLTNIFCPLVRGKSLRIYPQSQTIDEILGRAFQPGSGVDTLKLTPSHIYILEYMELVPSVIRKVIVGGEELTPRHVSILKTIDPAIEIYNEYGPTEATVGCIVKRIDSASAPVLIGRPIANTRVYILDEAGKPTPFGVRGEIHIAGQGLARGYHQRPDITAAKFIKHPFAGEERIYRTGDIGRWLPDGQIQSFGRIDEQIKIRGYRVELGEIEAALVEHHEVSAAAVVVREHTNGTRKLVGYVKGSGNLTAAGLKAYLAEKLPSYMVPADIVFVSEFTLNANGKLDRSALPALEEAPSPSEPVDATAIQTELLQIWRELFNTQAITLASRFFDLGGDSLLAVQLVARLWKAFSLEIGIDEIFELQTLEAIAGLIERSQASANSAAPAIRRQSRDVAIPLSFAQQRLWFLAQLEGPSTAYNLSSALRFEGELDVALLESAISEISRRHEVLRTTFPDINGRPAQSIAPPKPFTLAVIDAQGETQALELAAREAAQAFDLATGPLYRAVLYRVHPRLHILFVVMHHIVTDAWSSRILMEELSELYERRALPELVVQYADYAAWQRDHLQSDAAQKQLSLQKAALADAPDLLELPTDRPRPSIQTYHGASVQFHLDRNLTDALRTIAQGSDATLYMILLAGYALLLSRYSNQKDIVIGSSSANRTVREIEPLIGFFINTLALRIDVSGNPTFRELLARVKRVALDNYARQEIPFEQIVDSIAPERNLSHSPIFQVMFDYESASPDALQFPGLTVTPLSVETRTSKFDLTLSAQESKLGIAGALEYNTDLFDGTTVARMIDHLRNLMAAIAAHPDAPLASLSLLSSEERQRLTVEWNQTRADYPRAPLHRLFEQQVERSPQAVAAIFEAATLTYSELNARANRLAHQLISAGVTPDSLVGVSMERSLHMIVALLAIWKAGGAYVPIDPDYPAERVRFMLENSRVQWLLTQAHLASALPSSRAQVMLVDRETSSAFSEANPAPAITSANLAYMIYTSGSTGRPKGALNTHGAITNRIVWMQRTYGLTATDSVLQKTPFSFDVSVWEFFWPLIAGARLVFAKPGGQRESDYLIDLIEQQQITTLHFVPSMLRAFLEAPNVERCSSLRRVICSGEALPSDLQDKFFDRLNAELHNLYGPTEAAVDVTFWQCRRNDSGRSVPIGRPIANTQIYIVDESLEPCPIGIPGELLIGGIAVGQGYYREPELTRAKFIPDPFNKNREARLYRTGDLARYRPDGNIEFLGRLDNQIKPHGFRVELGEVEAALRSHPLVDDCIVVASQDSITTRMFAYVVAGQPLASADLRSFLRSRLPDYMVPSSFITLDSLPLLPNGKINRKALPKPGETQEAPRARELASSAREIVLANIWRDVLQLPAVGIHDNFFELGGDSILSIQVVSRANQAGLRITTKQFFQHQTIAELAAAPDEQLTHSTQIDPSGEAPLTPIQSWFFEQDLDEPSRFNQTALIQVPANIDPARLAEALRQIYAHHDALRLRFTRTASGWTQEVIPATDEHGIFAAQEIVPATDQHSIFAMQDIAAAGPEREAALLSAARAAEETLDITRGPLIAARLFRFHTGDAARLFIAAHHLAIDGVSWRILLEDLHTAYQGLPLPAKTAHFREWALHAWKLAQAPSFTEQASFWRNLFARGVEAVPVDNGESRTANYVGDTASLSFALSEAETAVLLRQLPQSYNARINDILLTALALAFRTTTGQARILVDLESHGRHESDSGIDLSRTVGWFTSIYPVILEPGPATAPEEAVKSIKQQLLRIPAEGFSYQLLRYLSSDEAIRRQLADLPKADILFNYHGQIDSALSRASGWSLAGEDLAARRADTAPRTHLFEIIAAVIDGKLQLDWLYSKRLHASSTIQSLTEQFQTQLRSLIAERPTLAEADSIEDRYELSPLQQGLLFHALYDQDPTAYFQQFSFTVEGALNVTALKQAWANAVQRHTILRTAFSWQDLERPIQIVSRTLELPWATHDWRSLAPDRRKQAFEAFLIQDRQRGFQLQQPPLFRCTLIQESDSLHRFCWSTHHIVLDGWSTAILMKEVFEDYVSLVRSGISANALAAPSYRRYIDWLSRQPRSVHEAWWREELKGFKAPTRLPSNLPGASSPGNGKEEDVQREQTLHLDERQTAQLQALVRTHHVTLNVLVRGAWATLLSRYSGTDDVLFGVTVSGRPPLLDGIESMVGLFINTIPARLRIRSEQSFLSWLAEIHSKQAEMEQHAASSLIDIHKWSEVPAGTSLFQSLVVFENFPVSGPRGVETREVEIRDIRSYSESNYPLTLTAMPDSRLGIRLSYDSRHFSSEVIQQMLAHIAALLESFIEEPARPCGTLLPDVRAIKAVMAQEPARTSSVAEPEADSRTTAQTPEEIRLLEIWETVLGRAGININDDYFELGGHSVLAVRLMAKVEQAFHRRLPISYLFQNPTVKKLAAALQQGVPAATVQGPVQIRGGGPAPPLFLLPGAGGNVIYFRPLASRLAETHAIYGLEAIGLDGSTPPLIKVEDIAARHIDLIWPIVGAGPYFLAGHSFGASVALEMSRQLIDKGATVGRLAIFDASAPVSTTQSAYWQSWDDIEWLLAIAHEIGTFLGADLGLTREELAPRDPEDRLTFIISRIASRGDWFAGAGPERLRAYLNVYQANFKAVYAPPSLEALPVPIALFKSSSEARAEDYAPSPEIARVREDASWGWSRFSSMPVDVFDAPGDHLTMLLEPNVATLAQHLDAFLKEGRP
jgi:amino acid adenylation domain-containing protein/non-ribosomal peptide synthase protein (TIGR01720 family)